MKVAIGALLLALVGFVVWFNGEIDDFTARCSEQGGHVESFGTAMRSMKCLTSDGRLIEIEGPGL